MTQFVRERRDKIVQLVETYSDDERVSPLFFQPEALLVFERMEHDKFALEAAWDDILPRDLLQDLGNIWGVGIS